MGYIRHLPKKSGRARHSLIAVILAGFVVAACSSQGKPSSQQSPGTALTNLGDRSSLRIAGSLDLTESQIESLAESGGGQALPAAEASALSRGSIFLGIQSGHGESLNSKEYSEDSANRSDLGLDIGSSAPLEIRVVDQTLYLHLDPATLSSLSGGSSAASQMVSELQKAAAVVPGLSALAQGGWVSVSASQLQSLDGMLSALGGTSGTTTTPADIPALGAQLSSEVLDALSAHSTYTDEGQSGGRTVYTVTVDATGFVNEVGPLVEKTLPASITGKLSGLAGQTANVPAGKTVTMTMYVTNDIVSEIDIDLRQLGAKADFPVPLHISFGEASISAPSGATSLNLSNLPQIIQGLGGGLPGSSSSSSSSAE